MAASYPLIVSNTINSLEEKKYTPGELAEMFKLHPDTVRRLFVDEPGVVRLGHGGRSRRRQYFSLRIPESVATRVFGRMAVGGPA